MEILQLIEQYGIISVIIGLVATIVCGLIKIPIVRTIKAKGYADKLASEKIRNYCTLIVTITSILGIGIVSIITKTYVWHTIMSNILLSITCSKVMYALYEGKYKNGEGIISIKTWMHKLFAKITSKWIKEIPETLKDTVDLVQNTLIEELHLPLTDEQIIQLQNVLRSKINEK